MESILSFTQNAYATVDFQQIRQRGFLALLDQGIHKAQEIMNGIGNLTLEKVNFYNSILVMEQAQEEISLLANCFYALHGAEADEEIQRLAHDFSAKITEFSNNILLDAKLFAVVSRCYEIRQQLHLQGEDLKLVEETYDEFVRNGALLSEEKKEVLRQLDQKLSQLTLAFGDHVLNDRNQYELVIAEKEKLQGLPQDFLLAALALGKSKGKEGQYIFNLDYPSYIPFMKYVQERSLREKLWRAHGAVSTCGENANQEVIWQIVQLRTQRAQLLGCKSHAEFVLQKRMAQDVPTVNKFLDDLLQQARPYAQSELRELQEFAQQKDGIQQLMRWDYAYYAEWLKREKLSFDEEQLRPYFPLSQVIEGIFTLAHKLYGLKFKLLQDVPAYHPEVSIYAVEDEQKNKFIGLLYMDFFPRKGKRQGAWMTHLRDQYRRIPTGETPGVPLASASAIQEQEVRPHVGIVCNFTPPQGEKPSLLSLNEVETLFHEFGHALHGLLSECRYRHFSGTNVYWDFVELPSQIMENWVYEKDCLDTFARHYQTGAKLPHDLIERIVRIKQFHEGYATMRQLEFALLDMAWHAQDSQQMPKGGPQELENYEKRILNQIGLLPLVAGTNVSCQFSHIFQGGYAAGYYSYKWAEVLDADAFEYFKSGDNDVAASFRKHILSRGGTEHPLQLYRAFRGKDPDMQALLRRSGLLSK